MKENIIDRFLRTLGRSQFFTYSALIHILLIAFFGTRVLYEQFSERPQFTGDRDVFVGDDKRMERPPEDKTRTESSNEKAKIKNSKEEQLPVKLTNRLDKVIKGGSTVLGPISINDNSSFRVAGGGLDGGPITPEGPRKPLVDGIPKMQAGAIADFTRNWRTSGPAGGVQGNSKFKFDAYLAQYAGGDWSSTHEIRDGEIVKGALPNLCYVMNIWSKDKVEARAMPKPLKLSSQEIFQIRPPFIFFSGTRDFVLTEAEVENLRKYLLVGGAVWGDSSLPGRNSRFDIAFRREMARVIGDKDKKFEPLAMDHKFFDLKYKLDGVPAGLNFYQEPVYAMSVYDEVAIIYTANGYGEMMRVGLDGDRKIDMRRNVQGNYVAISEELMRHRNTYFRNVSEEALVDTYEFSSNLVYHLLTRWENRVRGLR